MAQVLTVKPITESAAESGEECYGIVWIIPNWKQVRNSENLVNCQEATFETESSPTAWFKTRWLVGLKIVDKSKKYNRDCKIRMYWKLLGITGSKVVKLETKFQTQLWNLSTNAPKYIDEYSHEVKLLEIVEETNVCLEFRPELLDTDTDIMGFIETIMYKLKLTLKTPTMSVSEYDRYKMDQFSKTSVERLHQHLTAMLNGQSESSDLTIFTSDGVEIQAHRIILEARCPVFAAMLNCDLSENATGIIRMTDISGKTIKLLLHYFYTGELLPSWRDPDTIVEFMYAAGKYQMDEVLDLLDDMLGRNSEGDAGFLDVRLISMADKLRLENAERRLLRKIVAKITKPETTGWDLFELFGYEQEEIEELAETLATEQIGGSKIVRLMNYICGGTSDATGLFEKGMALLALVQKDDLRTAEKRLLERFVYVAESMDCTYQLFSLFGRGKRMGKEGLYFEGIN